MIKAIIVIACGLSIVVLLVGTLLWSARKAPYVYVCHHLKEFGDRDMISKLMQEYEFTEDEAYDLVQEVKRDLR
jgi:hypothetical protein